MTDEIQDDEAKLAAQVLDPKVTPRQLARALRRLCSPKRSNGTTKRDAAVFVWGSMGLGKTEIIRQIAADWKYRLVALHLAQFDPTDIKGIPVMLDGVVRWMPSSYLPQQFVQLVEGTRLSLSFDFKYAEQVQVLIYQDGKLVYRHNNSIAGDFNDTGIEVTTEIIDPKTSVKITLSKPLPGAIVKVCEKAIIFLDELSAAPPETQNAALNLVQDRRIGEYDVPENVPMIAAGNRSDDSTSVYELTGPLANRLCHLSLRVSAKEWLEDYAIPNGLMPEIIGWISQEGDETLHAYKPGTQAEGDYGFPTPRSITNLSEQFDPELDQDPAIRDAIFAGFIGKTFARSFQQFRELVGKMPDVNRILAGDFTDLDDYIAKNGAIPIGHLWYLGFIATNRLRDLFMTIDHTNSHDITKQPKEWQTATESFCTLADKYLGDEVTVSCLYGFSRPIPRSNLKPNMAYFRGAKGFREFALKWKEITKAMY